MKLVGFVLFVFAGSLFVSSGCYRLLHGERIPRNRWFRFCNEALRRRRYTDFGGPAARFLPPRLSILAGLFAIVAGIFLLIAQVTS
jgi:hypothetical protein